MKIGVISDTHIPANAGKLPQKVHDCLKSCDIIVHAGDITEKSFLDELEKLSEVKAVWGNMDSSVLRDYLPESIVFEVEGKKIGVIHGKGPSFKVFQYVKNSFKEKLDVIIFGHSHDPVNEDIEGTLYFNPGSPTDRIFAKYRSFGVIEITESGIKSEIIKVDG